jgi:hypothetical protein
MSAPFTLIDLTEGARAHAVRAQIHGSSVRVPPQEIAASLGWKLEGRGLCRGDVCVPVRDPAVMADREGIDLAALAHALGRPLALDVPEGVAAFGVRADERANRLATLEAPDFRLPDLAGRMHSLSEHRGKKVLLVAYASW